MASRNTKNGGDVVKLTKDELKVYDRQIRLWGYAGQKKLRTFRVLLIGLQGLGSEIAKNLILCGVYSITLKDHTDVSILDRCSQFLIPRNTEERNRAKASLLPAQKLNPNVKVFADSTPIEENAEDFVSSFDVVLATECSPETSKKLNEDCRKYKVLLLIGDVFGLFGYFFQDVTFKCSLYNEVFPNYDQRVSVPKNRVLPYYLTSALLRFQTESNRKPNPDTCEEDIEELKAIILSFDPATDLSLYEEYFWELFCEMSPTTSIVGAMMAQGAINSLLNRFFGNYTVFFYDHVDHQGTYYKY